MADDIDYSDLGFETPGSPLTHAPYNEDGYCGFCGNGHWKHHAPWCQWADAVDGLMFVLGSPLRAGPWPEGNAG